MNLLYFPSPASCRRNCAQVVDDRDLISAANQSFKHRQFMFCGGALCTWEGARRGWSNLLGPRFITAFPYAFFMFDCCKHNHNNVSVLVFMHIVEYSVTTHAGKQSYNKQAHLLCHTNSTPTADAHHPHMHS